MDTAARAFFANKYFAVAGASQAPDKFGYKILAWYHDRKLTVTPINPTRSTIQVEGTKYSTVTSPAGLPHPAETSLRSDPTTFFFPPTPRKFMMNLAEQLHDASRSLSSRRASLTSGVSTSIVTPPAVTRTVLEEAKASGLRAVWLQPGTFDAEVLNLAKQNFAVAIGGLEGATLGHEGWCVLVDGPKALESASRL